MTRVAIGLAIFLGFGAYGAWNAQRWAHWPKSPTDMTVAEAVQNPDAPWVHLTNGDWHCEFAYTEGTFTYVALTDGQFPVLVGYEGKPGECPPKDRPSGAFREINGNLLETVKALGFRPEAIAKPAGTPTPPPAVYVLFTHEGPGNFIVTVPVLFALSGIGLWYALSGRRGPKSSGVTAESANKIRS